jgi:protein ImuB
MHQSIALQQLRDQIATIKGSSASRTVLPDHARRVVAAGNHAALAQGIRPGMIITKARSFAPELPVMDAGPAGVCAGLQPLALWATRHDSPVAGHDLPHGIWMRSAIFASCPAAAISFSNWSTSAMKRSR